MDMGGDLRMPARRMMVDPGGGEMGPRTPAKGREGIDLNVGMFRPSFGVHPNQMLLNGRFLLNSGTRLGQPLIHNHNLHHLHHHQHHHDHQNPNGVSFGSGSGCDLNFLPNIGGIAKERMAVNENMMPLDQGVIDLTDEADAVNNNGEPLLLLQQQQQKRQGYQQQFQIEHHVDFGLSREQSVVRVASESGEGDSVIVATEGLVECQQIVGEKQCVIGEEQVIDLNKTPQQKPRRKKHRPKVVREGKPAKRGRKATPKPVTPKPTTERPTGKRKYVRRKNVTNPVETPSEPLGECVESENANWVTAARRSLNFISEGLTGEGCTVSAPVSVPMSSFNIHSSEFRDQSLGGVHNFSSLSRGGSPAMHAGMSSQTRMPLDLGQSTSQNPTWFESRQISNPNPQSRGRGYAAINHVPGEFRGNIGIPTPYPQFQERGYRSVNHIQQELIGNPEIPAPPLQPSRNGMVRDNLNSLAASSDIRFRNGLNSSLSDLILQVARKDHDANRKRKLEELSRLPYKAPKNWNLNHVGQTRPSQFSFADAQRFIAIEKMKASEVMVASHPVKRNENIISNRCFQANSLMLAISSTVNHNVFPMAENPCGDGILSSKDPVTPEKLSSRQNRGLDGVIRKPRTPRGNRATDNNAKAKTKNTEDKLYPGSRRGDASAKNTPRHQAELQKNSSLHQTYVQKTPLEAVADQENHSRHLKISSIQDCQSSTDFQESAHSTITSLGFMPSRDPVDDIIQKLTRMSINRTSESVTAEEQHALVPYNGGGTMVPYEGPYDPTKRRRPRPKVDLDPETSRVWRLLLIKDSIDGDTELDKNKEKWWEEERRVFRGRVDSFIARMHLVQGDRRFSPWKGSVVDSVVGVFLTQNVSDHLSSSAFMSLAAKFPFKADNKPKVEKESKPFKPEHCISSFKDAMKFQELQGKEFPHNNYIVTHEAEDTEEQHIVDIRNSPGTHPRGDGPVGYTKDEGIFFHGSEVGASHPSPDSRIGSPFTVSPSLSSSETGFRSSPGDAASKQKSAISSQNSSEYPAQTVDQIGTCLESNPRSEELSIENMCNFLDGYTSFTNLLKMAENTGFDKFYTTSSGGISSEHGSVVNQLTSTESGKGTILDLLDNPDGACSSAVMPNNPDKACRDFMGVTSKSSASSRNYSSTNFMSEEKAYRAIEERTHLPFAPLNFMANNVAGRECIPSVGNKADITDKLESSTSETTTLLGARTPLQKIPLHQLDGSARKNCFDKQLPAEALDTALSKSISLEEPKSHAQYMTKDQQINEETSALGETSQPTAAVQTRNSVVYQSPKSSPNNTEQAAHNLGAIESKSIADVFISEKAPAETVVDGSNRKRPRADLERKKNFDWDSLRKQVHCEGIQTERSSDRMDSVDWEAVRLADVSEISETIRERGMNNMLAERIKDFLNRLVTDHGSVDLEWLRDVPPDKTKEYLLSIRGLGLKSVECVRLLTLHHLAFPVDTNVGRISVRLGWVPLQPLPESLQLHLLEMYPVLETIQKYLWPRLCRLDQRTLYELHYQLITFGKVFCTKSKPNCNACPMRGECKHFASAFASARLALPGPEEKGIVSSVTPIATENNQNLGFTPVPLPQLLGGNNLSQERTVIKNCEPIIEEPATPEPEYVETSESAIEDYFDEDPDEIPVIKLNLEEFTQNLQNFMQENNLDIQEGDMSKALVALAPEAASIPMPKLKNVSRLRTEHQVYEIPDGHPLLEGLDRREPDDPCSYLLAIWAPGETAQSNEPPKTCCDSQETGKLCDKITCFSCNSVREAQSQIVRATLLIPCRTAMRGSFPLNGTYFQVNEVFADHESSHNPINVPRESIWNLPRRTVYFGTSIPSIFRGLSTEGIQHCFWRGFVCVRGFDRITRAPRPLSRRLHFPASKVTRDKQNGPKREQ